MSPLEVNHAHAYQRGEVKNKHCLQFCRVLELNTEKSQVDSLAAHPEQPRKPVSL